MSNSITQKMKYKQSVIKFSEKYGVYKASIQFNEWAKTIKQYIKEMTAWNYFQTAILFLVQKLYLLNWPSQILNLLKIIFLIFLVLTNTLKPYFYSYIYFKLKSLS